MKNSLLQILFKGVTGFERFFRNIFVSKVHANDFETTTFYGPPEAGLIRTPQEMVREYWLYILIPVILIGLSLFFGIRALVRLFKKSKKKSKKK